MKYDDQQIREAKKRILKNTPLADLIGEHSDLKKSHDSLLGRCPFPDHEDKNPDRLENPP